MHLDSQNTKENLGILHSFMYVLQNKFKNESFFIILAFLVKQFKKKSKKYKSISIGYIVKKGVQEVFQV